MGRRRSSACSGLCGADTVDTAGGAGRGRRRRRRRGRAAAVSATAASRPRCVEHHPLRRAGRAAGEDEPGGRVGTDRIGGPEGWGCARGGAGVVEPQHGPARGAAAARQRSGGAVLLVGAGHAARHRCGRSGRPARRACGARSGARPHGRRPVPRAAAPRSWGALLGEHGDAGARRCGGGEGGGERGGRGRPARRTSSGGRRR